MKHIPATVAPPGEESLYRDIWDYWLWGFNQDDILSAVQAKDASVTRDTVRAALKSMQEELNKQPYGELAEDEYRRYLARNYQTENELVQLYLQAQADLQLLRSGQVKHADGTRPMPVDTKMLVSLLGAIEKQSQSRVTLLNRLAQPKESGGGAPQLESLTGAAAGELMSSLTRRPEVPEEVVDADFRSNSTDF